MKNILTKGMVALFVVAFVLAFAFAIAPMTFGNSTEGTAYAATAVPYMAWDETTKTVKSVDGGLVRCEQHRHNRLSYQRERHGQLDPLRRR